MNNILKCKFCNSILLNWKLMYILKRMYISLVGPIANSIWSSRPHASILKTIGSSNEYQRCPLIFQVTSREEWHQECIFGLHKLINIICFDTHKNTWQNYFKPKSNAQTIDLLRRTLLIYSNRSNGSIIFCPPLVNTFDPKIVRQLLCRHLHIMPSNSDRSRIQCLHTIRIRIRKLPWPIHRDVRLQTHILRPNKRYGRPILPGDWTDKSRVLLLILRDGLGWTDIV